MKIATEIERTKTAVSNITNWCITIALNQEFGIGKGRLDKVHGRICELADDNTRTLMTQGKVAGQRQRNEWVAGLCDSEFRVPLTRAARTNREKQLVMAGNAAATMSWQIYSKACADVLGFGTARLSRLKDESWKNYQQFNEWYREDGIDVAMERMRRCAEQALQEEIAITDVDETADTVEREFRKQQTQRIQAKRAAEAAHARAIREHTVMLNGKNVMERCNAHLQEIMCGNGLRK